MKRRKTLDLLSDFQEANQKWYLEGEVGYDPSYGAELEAEFARSRRLLVDRICRMEKELARLRAKVRGLK